MPRAAATRVSAFARPAQLIASLAFAAGRRAGGCGPKMSREASADAERHAALTFACGSVRM